MTVHVALHAMVLRANDDVNKIVISTAALHGMWVDELVWERNVEIALLGWIVLNRDYTD